MNPSVLVSWGELIDKVTILEIKQERLTSEAALANVRHELAQLSGLAQQAASLHPEIARLKSELKHVNETLWQIEDEVRDKEAAKSFDAEFIRLARAVYHNNDARGRLKQEINILLKSSITEEKQYSRY
jgi:regulator of replication initiation timing